MRAFWKSTEAALPPTAPSTWHNILTGESLQCTARRGRKYLPVGAVLENFPVALLVPESK